MSIIGEQEQTRTGRVEVRRLPMGGGRRYSGPLIDCDVHHAWRTQDDLLPYMTKGWQEYVKGPGLAGPISVLTSPGFQNPHGFEREDTFPPTGGPPGSDYDTLKNQLLDRLNVNRAVLTYGDGLFVGGIPSPYFAAEIARASNEWTIEQWLSRDYRLWGSILVANQLPTIAASEIRRLAKTGRMAQVLLAGNGVAHALGHPTFHPIYEAASEVGLPVTIHAGGAGGINPRSTAGGSINLYIEYHTLAIQGMMTHLVSFITHGVFEKFPNLKLLLMEGGIAWLPSLLWRLDTNYKGLRREVPWLKKLPSEYFLEHVWVSTQPLELSPKREQMIRMLEFIDGEHKLIFATDYPHWDSDEVDFIATRIPTEWLPPVMYENALELYGWRSEDATMGDTQND